MTTTITLPPIPLDLYSRIEDRTDELRGILRRLEEIAEEVNALGGTLDELGRTVFTEDDEQRAPVDVVDAFGNALSRATGYLDLHRMMKRLTDIAHEVH